MKMNMGAELGGEEATTMETYFVQEGNNYIMYMYSEGTWAKTTLPEDQLSSQMMQMSPADSMDLYMKHLKEAVKEGEEEIDGVKTDKIKLVASGDMFKELMANMSMDDLGLGSTDGLTAEVLENFGDLTYYIWVNKEDNSVVKMQMDLSSAMRNMATAMTGENAPGEMSDMEKELLRQTFENLTMTLDYFVKNINEATDFTLPEEAASAPEMPLE